MHFIFQAYLLQQVISYLESDVTSLGYGLGLTAGVLACEMTRACSFANLMIFGAQTGIDQTVTPSGDLRPLVSSRTTSYRKS